MAERLAGLRPRRLVYLGSPPDAVPPLDALVAAGHDVDLVVTQPDKRRGRGGTTMASPVKAAAERLGIPVSHSVDDVIDVGADLGVVVAFGRLVKPHVLEAVPMVNLHFSLLPRWRGAAPVERAILAGDEVTGVCLMVLEEGLDTGPVLRRQKTPIGRDESAAELRARLVEIGTTMLVETLREGLPPAVPQEGEPTYAAKLEPSDFELDWARPAVELHRVVRAGSGRAHTTYRGKRLKVHGTTLDDTAGTTLAPGELEGALVGTGEGTLRLVAVQPEGKGVLAADDWARGARSEPGERLGA